MATVAASSSNSSAVMATLIARGDSAAMMQFYDGLVGIRHYLCRKWGSDDVEDLVHDTFLETVLAIRKGLRNPECVWGLAHAVARHSVGRRIARKVCEEDRRPDPADQRPNPEQRAIVASIIEQALGALGEVDQEILTRLLQGETQTGIQAAMHLSPTRFRNLKNRATQRFAMAGKRISSLTH